MVCAMACVWTRPKACGDIPADARRGLGQRSQAAHHVGDIRAQRRYYDAYYLKAQQVRTLIKSDFDAAFREVDVIACPVAPTTAFKIGEKVDDRWQMYLSDVSRWRATGWNLRHQPALRLGRRRLADWPANHGPAFGEESILRVAHTYEQATEWHTYRPQIPADLALEEEPA